MKKTGKQHSAIPVVDFYGESRNWPLRDLVHCENLSLRSGEHNWHIKPHRHQSLLQLFFVSRGSGAALVDDRNFRLVKDRILVIPSMSVHTLTWTPGSEGYVMMLALPLMHRFVAELETRPWSAADALLFDTSNSSELIKVTFDMILQEYGDNQVHRIGMMESLVKTLIVWLERQRQLRLNHRNSPSKGETRLNSFTGLIEENYAYQHTVSWYALQLGVTAPHLTSICRKLAGKGPLQLINNRILLEAQRKLLYSGESATEISQSLGFSDPAYFNRFFKRLTGMTPGDFRAQTYQGK